MELQAVIAALATGDGADALEPGWSTAQASMPSGPLFFLEPAFVSSACDDAGLAAEIKALTRDTAARVAASDPLRALAWYCYSSVYRDPTYPRAAIAAWPSPAAALGEQDSLFYLLILLSGMPELQRLYRTHDIPSEVAKATLFDIERWLRVHRARHGNWGLGPDRINWLRNHMRGELYQLGRLQFQFGAFAPGFHVFRHKGTGQVIALAGDGLQFRGDGQLDGAGGVADPNAAWLAHFDISEDAISGISISPRGAAEQEVITLSRTDWQPALSPGDPVLHLHIPAGSPMDFDACGQSLQQALQFFPQHFPRRPFVAFACSSWLLDAQLEQMLPSSSNLVRFLREMYLLPSRSSGAGTLERVFGTATIDPHTAPRDTTLRRAIADHLLAGGHLRGARCFLFPRDLDWGGQVYRRRLVPKPPA